MWSSSNALMGQWVPALCAMLSSLAIAVATDVGGSLNLPLNRDPCVLSLFLILTDVLARTLNALPNDGAPHPLAVRERNGLSAAWTVAPRVCFRSDASKGLPAVAAPRMFPGMPFPACCLFCRIRHQVSAATACKQRCSLQVRARCMSSILHASHRHLRMRSASSAGTASRSPGLP